MDFRNSWYLLLWHPTKHQLKVIYICVIVKWTINLGVATTHLSQGQNSNIVDWKTKVHYYKRIKFLIGSQHSIVWINYYLTCTFYYSECIFTNISWIPIRICTGFLSSY